MVKGLKNREKHRMLEQSRMGLNVAFVIVANVVCQLDLCSDYCKCE